METGTGFAVDDVPETVRERPMKLLRASRGVLVVGAILAAGSHAVRPVKGASAAGPAPHGIEGFWQGALDTGAIPLRLVFKIEKKADGSMTGTLDSLDQGAKGIPLSGVSLTDAAVRIEVKVVSGVYEGKLSASGGQMTGEWKQGGATLPLTLQHVEKV